MQAFNYIAVDVVFQEVPDEVSLAFTISGCPLGCEGCHSADTWDARQGEPLSTGSFRQMLEQYHGLITCVVFFGGEWQREHLINLLKMARQRGLKTCLYTGLNKLPESIKTHLTFVKTGPWKPNLGGLDQPTTNQRFIRVDNNQLLNYKFIGA